MARLNSEELLTPDEIQRLETLAKRKDEVIERIRALEGDLMETQREMDALGVENMDSSEALSDPKHAVLAFNRKPKQTVERLIAAGVIPANDPKTVAGYLWSTPGISKKALGDYITAENKFCNDVLHEFIYLQQFEDSEVLPALRAFLNSFEMGGEGQIVDRVMTAFAHCYCQVNKASVFKSEVRVESICCNSSLFFSGDCHLFLYAVMLLQTTLHNPNVKLPMKCADFVKLCDSCNLPKEFLTKTYGDVKKRPFKHDELAAVTRNVLLRNAAKKGFLFKQGSTSWGWKKRYFVLMAQGLWYYEDMNSSTARGFIQLEHLHVRPVTENVPARTAWSSTRPPPNMVTICKLESDGYVPKSTHNCLRLSAESSKEVQEWIHAIEQSSWMDEYKCSMETLRARVAPQ
ncbi:Cytohesin-1-like isoform X2 [Aphelenchoides fujianensis]|nr:Cytohesin-1-like isoform X2 [Aphelenchoides fujianensis]